MKFRKKPVVIEAWQFESRQQIIIDAPHLAGDPRIRFDGFGENVLHIRTLEGEMEAWAGDWIIRGIKGELCPCKPDIFEATYEPVPE